MHVLRCASKAWVVAIAGLLFVDSLSADPRCAGCHPKEVAGYATSAMARSLAPVGAANNAGQTPPDGSFEHRRSQTRFFVHSTAAGMTQGLTNPSESVEQQAAFVVGSGSHAVGYLIQIGDHVFQSPLSYYTDKRLWDVAPGYEFDRHPDFTRPVTAACLFCHSGRPLPIPESVNRYWKGVFATYAISCDRCHGNTEAHLKNPIPGSIVNPAKLEGAARSSVCEQCHLVGETRIANPDKSITDFQVGQTLESFYTTYLATRASGEAIKVVSHAEQLALSLCARRSGDKLWCGTCHNPHDKPVQSATYFRERCLTCHAATLNKEHAAPGRDCTGCHMPKAATRDGGHTAFTNHRIMRRAETASSDAVPDTLTAWREPEPALRERNLGLAMIAYGLENGDPNEAVRGFRLLSPLEKDFAEDPAVLTSLGTVLMKARQPAEALKRFEKVVLLKPNYPPYRMNIAMALAATGRPTDAVQQLETALRLDPLFQAAVELLGKLYREQGQPEKADLLTAQYRQVMGMARNVPSP